MTRRGRGVLSTGRRQGLGRHRHAAEHRKPSSTPASVQLEHGPADEDAPALDRVADVLFEILAGEG